VHVAGSTCDFSFNPADMILFGCLDLARETSTPSSAEAAAPAAIKYAARVVARRVLDPANDGRADQSAEISHRIDERDARPVGEPSVQAVPEA
jgi:hypothetical protein